MTPAKWIAVGVTGTAALALFVRFVGIPLWWVLMFALGRREG